MAAEPIHTGKTGVGIDMRRFGRAISRRVVSGGWRCFSWQFARVLARILGRRVSGSLIF
jgi:hypothetical protein